MLQCQYCRWDEHRHLFAVVNAFECCPDGHFRFAESHIAANQPVHGMGSFHVFFHILCGFQLVGGVFINKRGLELVLQVSVGHKLKTFGSNTFGIKPDKVPCDIFYPFLGFVFQVLPRIRTQLV